MVLIESHGRIMPSYALAPSAPNNPSTPPNDPCLTNGSYMRAYNFLEAAIVATSKQANL